MCEEVVYQLQEVIIQEEDKLVTVEGKVRNAKPMYINADEEMSQKLEIEDFVRGGNTEIVRPTEIMLTKGNEFLINNYTM